METIKQIQIANFAGLSPQMICEIKKGRRALSRRRAANVAARTGAPYEELASKTGAELYRVLVTAFIIAHHVPQRDETSAR